MGTKPRGKTYATDFVVKGVRYRASFDHYEDGVRWEEDVRHAIKTGRPAPEPNNKGKTQGGGRVQTLGQLRDYVLKNHYAVHARRSLDWAERNLRLCLEYLGEEMLVEDVDELALDRMAEHFRQEGNSNSTVNRKLAALSKALTIAHKKLRIIDRKPSVPLTREHQGRIRFLTREEETAMLVLLQRWGQQDLHDLIAFAIDTGARRGEILSAKWVDFDGLYERWTIWENKADHPRTVPLTKRAREIVKRRRRETNDHTGPFIKMTPASFRAMFDRMTRHLALDDVVFHTLRHTCASRLVQAGVDLRRVQEWLGHKRIETTLCYAHLSPRDLELARDALEMA